MEIRRSRAWLVVALTVASIAAQIPSYVPGVARAVPAAASAADTLDQSATPTGISGDFDVIGGDSTPIYQWAQTVTTGKAGPLTKVRLPIACPSSSNLRIEIQTLTGGGLPSDILLTSRTVTGLTDDFTMKDITFSEPVSFASGQRFAIVAMELSSSNSLRCRWQRADGDVYSGGTKALKPSSGAWDGVSGDFGFETYVGSAAINGIARCDNGDGSTLMGGATVDLLTGQVLITSTIADATTGAYLFTGVAPNATYTLRYTKTFVFAGRPPYTIRCSTTTATDALGNSGGGIGTYIPNHRNHTWVTALPITSGVSVNDFIFEQGQSTWFKISITRGQRVTVTVTNVPADYSVALYKNIQAIYDKEIAALAGADPLAAVHAHDASVAPDALSPDALSPDALSPDALSPDALSPDALSPDALSPDALSPDELSPDELSPDALSPDALSPDALSPDALSPDALSQAYSGAQTSALIGVSAHVGLSPEQISRNTWDNNDFFYVRVRGHNGAFDGSSPFTIKVATTDVSCNGASLLLEYPQTPAVTETGAQTLIITNTARLSGDTTAFKAKLDAFKTRADVQGVVLDLATMPSFTAPYAQWDAKLSCPAAANILAHSIKDVIDAYAAANSNLRYVVLAGNDGVIPFFRQPDQSGLGSEKDYFPSVQESTASQASLRLGYVLTQDFYGSLRPISRMDHELFLPDLAVGRLVETIPQMSAVIDAYTFANGTVSPTTALVTGYDFLSDTAAFIATQLQANSLTVDRSLIQPIGDTSKSPTAWTGDQLKAKLLGATTFGILSLNGHFSSNTLLAADFATRVRTSDITSLPAGDPRFRNSLVLSTGCHSGYNTVDGAQTTLTDPADWAQTFAARGATVVGGTGYQYGDTDFMKYSEQILANTTLELRYGAGGIPIGVALANAKRAYAATLPSLKGIDEKALAEATLYGLPMLGYNLPAATRLTRPAETTVPAPTAGTSAGLSVASVSPSYTLTRNTRSLANLGGAGSQTALWYDINGNVAVSPGAPVLPQLSFDATKAATVARGAVLLGATYKDENALPFTDVATTEVRAAHARSRTDVFTPVRPFALNQNVGTHLVSTPFQFRSAPGLSTGVARRLTTETFRLYYSSLADARALASAPAVYTVNLAPDGAGNVTVTAIVGGLRTVGIEEIFATYTGEAGSLYEAWTSTAPLTLQSTVTNALGAFAMTFVGTIPLGTTTANDLRVLIQAVGGNGLVSFASNDGAYYRVPNETATASDPKVTTELTLTVPASATYRSTVPVSATLSTAAGPLAGKPVAFRSSGIRIDAMTNASGVASAQLFVRSAPDAANVSVGFAEEQHYLGSGAQTDMSVSKAPSVFTLLASAPLPTGGSTLIATLRGGTELLGSQAVTLSGAGRTVQTFTDGYGRVRLDATDGFPSGAYSVSITYDGNDRYGPASSTANVLAFDSNGFAAGVGSIVAGSDAVGFTRGKRVGFAFAAVYRRNATTPIGLFEVLSLDSHVLFSATSFDWLAVSGTRAEMLGHGNVNGHNGWSFHAVAVDGTPGTADRIEISIWQDGVTTYTAPTYRVTGTVARGIIVRLLKPSERDFGPLQLRGLAERE